MIKIVGLYKNFDETIILKNINVIFEKGKINILIGKSGSGKTTLTKCIVGLLKPNSGQIFFQDKDFCILNKKQQKDIRQQIGFLFQGGALFDSMTVEENILFPLKMYTKMTKKEMIKRVDFCLERVNLKNANELFTDELSGGMKKRVGIARAISLQPKYLFCDEPNSGLDPKTSNLIDNLIREITYEYNITTVVITHDMNSILEIGDQICFIHNGRIVWTGNKDEILTTKKSEVVDFVYVSKYMKMLRNYL